MARAQLILVLQIANAGGGGVSSFFSRRRRRAGPCVVGRGSGRASFRRLTSAEGAAPAASAGLCLGHVSAARGSRAQALVLAEVAGAKAAAAAEGAAPRPGAEGAAPRLGAEVAAPQLARRRFRAAGPAATRNTAPKSQLATARDRHNRTRRARAYPAGRNSPAPGADRSLGPRAGLPRPCPRRSRGCRKTA